MIKPFTFLQRRWAAAIAWTLLIYATIPIGRPVVNYFRDRGALWPIMNVATAAAIGSFIVWALARKNPGSKLRQLSFAAALAVYVLALGQVRYPEERIHFFEYSFLAFLNYRALSTRLADLQACAGALALSFAAGWTDEILQHLHPDRHYSFHDVLINLAGAAFGLIFLGILSPQGKR